MYQTPKFGIHIPVMGLGGKEPTKENIISVAQLAESLGYDSLSVNDHIVFHTSWLDALTTLSVVAASTKHILVGTSILNIVVRNPVVCAKALAAIDIVSTGRLFAGVGPGSYRGDYDVCGFDFGERWPRFSEALRVLIMLLNNGNNKNSSITSGDNNGYSTDGDSRNNGSSNGGNKATYFNGKYYTLKDVLLLPRPVQKPHLPIYVGSWGSEAGLKRLAKYSDGWMASAYNVTPAKFKEKWNFLMSYRKSLGKGDEPFDNSVMTMFGYIHDSKDKVRSAVKEILSPALGRSPEELDQMLLFGSSDECIRKIRELADAGVKRIHFWPVLDYEEQICVFKNEICTHL
jgi:alkanesulfonate monooxygenase SsuD/methylene tetrahydromethanopterin reductase-like flavin-dependent oxidoreductase (luciferase family)